jgi:hypothetical protein
MGNTESGLSHEQFQELLELAKREIDKDRENGETFEERMADSAFNKAAEIMIDRDRPGEFRDPNDVGVVEALQAQVSALLGIGQLLEAILHQLQNK